MKVTVIGGRGFFGSWLVPALEEYHDVEIYDVVDGNDIFDVKNLTAKLKGREAAIHLAAIPSYKASLNPALYVRLNIVGVARVVEAMKAAKVKKLVYAASGAVYGFEGGKPSGGWVKPPISERQYPADWNALNVYSAGNLAVEAWLPLALGYGWAVTSLRINCIEPHHKGVLDQGHHWGWWCSQKMAASAFLAALAREKTGFEIVNVGEHNENMDYTMLDKLLDGEL